MAGAKGSRASVMEALRRASEFLKNSLSLVEFIRLARAKAARNFGVGGGLNCGAIEPASPHKVLMKGRPEAKAETGLTTMTPAGSPCGGN